MKRDLALQFILNDLHERVQDRANIVIVSKFQYDASRGISNLTLAGITASVV